MFKIYNSKNKTLEEFYPLDKKEVKIYLCGPTVYDDLHIGNGRNLVILSTLTKFLKYFCNYNVKYVSNITDIDDKIIKKSLEKNKNIKEITNFYIKRYLEIYNKLGLNPDIKMLCATDYIDIIIKDIKEMIKNKYAYFKNGNVFFLVNKFFDYLDISNQKKEDLHIGKRIQKDLDKKNYRDFILWKQKKDENVWKSPWGFGRPGWHSECFSIIKSEFKTPIDIHAGGVDLKFPHHENENIQARSFGWPYISKYWLWNGFVEVENGNKMSKSLGNHISLEMAVRKYNVTTINYWYLSSHYRQPIKFCDSILSNIKKEAEKIKRTYKDAITILKLTKTPINTKLTNIQKQIEKDFFLEYCNDINTPNSLMIFQKIVKEINILKRNINEENLKTLSSYILLFERFDYILGLMIKETLKLNISEEEIKLYKTWIFFQNNKEYNKADKIRKILKDRNINI